MTPRREIPPEVRAERFGAYLGALASQVMDERGWNVVDFCRAAGISRQTFYRWRRGDWSDGEPTSRKVRELHTQLGLSPGRALDMLGLVAPGEEPAIDPLDAAEPQVAEDIRGILRRLADPNEDADEKSFIRRSLANLAGRSQSGSRRPRNRPAV